VSHKSVPPKLTGVSQSRGVHIQIVPTHQWLSDVGVTRPRPHPVRFPADTRRAPAYPRRWAMRGAPSGPCIYLAPAAHCHQVTRSASRARKRIAKNAPKTGEGDCAPPKFLLSVRRGRLYATAGGGRGGRARSWSEGELDVAHGAGPGRPGAASLATETATETAREAACQT
jgi:hypothetical protein